FSDAPISRCSLCPNSELEPSRNAGYGRYLSDVGTAWARRAPDALMSAEEGLIEGTRRRAADDFERPSTSNTCMAGASVHPATQGEHCEAWEDRHSAGVAGRSQGSAGEGEGRHLAAGSPER